MSPKKIQVGKTYKNCGAGKTQRTVLAIEDERVLYEQNESQRYLSLKSFAQWAGGEI